MRHKLLKRVAAIIFIVALVCGLCGCTNTDEAESASNEMVAGQTKKPTYSLQLDVNCQENLFFSRYDVNILVDGTSIGILDHGASKTYELDLEEGSHVLRMEKEDDSTVDGSVDFEITQESYASCSLSLSSDQVAIKDFQIISNTEKEEQERAEQEKAAEAEAEDTVKNKEEAETQAEQEEVASQAQSEAEVEKANAPLTAKNDSSFATFLKSEDYKVISNFANTHIGQIIEFDGNVADVSHHENFNTRFDYLIYVGNYSKTSAHGPVFQFEDVNYYDLKLADESPDTIGVGLNLHIKAKIIEYDSLAGITKLKPIETSVR